MASEDHPIADPAGECSEYAPIQILTVLSWEDGDGDGETEDAGCDSCVHFHHDEYDRFKI